jgi:hypothetical protein
MWDRWETQRECLRRVKTELRGYSRAFNKASIRNTSQRIVKGLWQLQGWPEKKTWVKIEQFQVVAGAGLMDEEGFKAAFGEVPELPSEAFHPFG